MNNNFRLLKAITVIALGISLTASTVGFYSYLTSCTSALLIGFLVFLLGTNKKSIIHYYSALEANHAIALPSDSKVWGIKPKYRKMAPYAVALLVIFGWYGFSFATDAANGTPPGRKERLIYDLFGQNGVVFMWYVISPILIVGAVELGYYLWKTKKNA